MTLMLYHTKTIHQTLDELEVSVSGLAVTDAQERLRIYGENAIQVAGTPLWRKLLEPFTSIFMAVLFAAVIISIVKGAVLDASIVALIMTINATIYYVQSYSTARIMRSLQKHHQQSVEVLRDNKTVLIDAAKLVPGDIILLGEGEKVPADARLIALSSLRVDEAQLTGESEPVSKSLDPLPDDKEIYEQSNMLFQGSFIIAGEATAVVVSTGNDTEFGHLAALTKDASDESPVQRKIDVMITHIIAAVTAIATAALLLSLLRGVSLSDSLGFMIALSVSAVPEGLPVAISIVLVLGMRRMAAKKALVRTMQSIETVGALTTIATDKTGTLTKNKLTVQASWQLPHAPHHLKEVIARAINYRSQKLHDPLDTALHEYVGNKAVSGEHHRPLTVFPFDQSTAMSGNLWHHGATYDLTVKGAPEHVMACCDLTEGEHEAATAKLHELTAQGFRVIAVAQAALARPLGSFNELNRTQKLSFVGFVAVADILRPEAKRSIIAAQKAGVGVRMITGDHFETAFHIGRELGMVTHRGEVFDSRRLHVMSDEELDDIIEDIKVFSRVIPEHKYRILTILKKHHICAMTGDGVNDVPALSAAHVGIAMGSGAQIAKDASDIILLNDNFKGIVDAMSEGRTILANIRRMLFYLLATNTGEVLTMLGSLALNMPVPLLPVQILWVNLVTDSAMVIPLGLEPGEKANMTRPPKSPQTPILSKFMISRIILLAATMAVMTLSMYAYFSSRYGHAYGQTIAFSALVAMQWASALCARSDYQSTFSRLKVFSGAFYGGLAVAVSLQALAVFGPLGQILHIAPVAIGDLVVTGVVAFVVPIVLMEAHKFIGRRFYHKGT